MILRIVSILASLDVVIMPAEEEEPKPLFGDESVLRLQITFPSRALVRNAEKSTAPHPAKLLLAGDASEKHKILLSARGNSRRDKRVCEFPPLRVEFIEKASDESLFVGQKRLKLVTHCRPQKKYQQYYLLEFAAYKLFNVMTTSSLRVRLAEIDYIDSENEKIIATRYGFFIEDTDDAAKRLGVKEIDVDDIDVAQLNARAAGTYSIFQYMIGNLDWSMHDGGDEKDCCHNTKLIGQRVEPLSDLHPVPYDFDYSGIVDAPYAVPPTNVRVRSVRSRRYRGFCVHNEAARSAAAEFVAKRDELFAVLNNVPGMDDRSRRSAERFMDDFFEDISDDETLYARLLKDCRG